jgi:hypothetical protein
MGNASHSNLCSGNSGSGYNKLRSQGCPAARRELLLRARNGGSVPPEYFREKMVPLMASGKLVLLENAKVTEVTQS